MPAEQTFSTPSVLRSAEQADIHYSVNTPFCRANSPLRLPAPPQSSIACQTNTPFARSPNKLPSAHSRRAVQPIPNATSLSPSEVHAVFHKTYSWENIRTICSKKLDIEQFVPYNVFMNMEHYVPNTGRQYDKRKRSCNYARRIGFYPAGTSSVFAEPA